MKQHNAILTFLLLLTTSFMSFKPFVENPLSPILLQVVGMVLLVYCYKTMTAPAHRHLVFRAGSIWVLWSFALSMVSSYVLYNQGFYYSLKAVSPWVLCVCLYFLCVKWRIREDFILRFMVIFSVVFTLAEILQQFTYPVLLFNGRAANEVTGDVEQRMGLWRLYIFGIDYCVLTCLFCFQKVMQKSRKHLWLLIITFLGVVFFVARKNIFAVVGCFFVGTIFSGARSSKLSKVLMGVFVIAIFMILPSYMADLMEQTSSEIDNEDFIRYLAADYFINHFNDSPLYVIFGSGLAGGTSALFKQIKELQEYQYIFKSDCGFIGYYSDFGLFGLGAMLYLVIRIIRNYKYVDMYLLLYLLLRIEISFFDFWGNYPRNLSAWFIYLYLVECSIFRNRKKRQTLCQPECKEIVGAAKYQMAGSNN